MEGKRTSRVERSHSHHHLDVSSSCWWHDGGCLGGRPVSIGLYGLKSVRGPVLGDLYVVDGRVSCLRSGRMKRAASSLVAEAGQFVCVSSVCDVIFLRSWLVDIA